MWAAGLDRVKRVLMGRGIKTIANEEACCARSNIFLKLQHSGGGLSGRGLENHTKVWRCKCVCLNIYLSLISDWRSDCRVCVSVRVCAPVCVSSIKCRRRGEG